MKKMLLGSIILIFVVICVLLTGCKYFNLNTTKSSTTSTDLVTKESKTTKGIITTTMEEPTTKESSTIIKTEEPVTDTISDIITDSTTSSETTSSSSTMIHSDESSSSDTVSDIISSDISTTDDTLDYAKGIIEEYSTNMHICDDDIVEDVIYKDFQIHFIETGVYKTGDVIFIKAGDTDIMIDAGPSTSTISDIINYIDNFCTDGKLEYVIVTHSHSDHWAGMYGSSSSNNGILYKYKVDTLIQFAITNKTSTASTTEYGKYMQAVGYAQNNGAVVYNAAECFENKNGASSVYILDENKGITMTILYNYYYFNKSSDENNHSVCTLFSYNNKHYLLTGDLEGSGEKKMAEYYDGSTPEKTLPEVELFKAGHHGSQTSSTDALLSIIKPKISIACCCAGSTEYTVFNDNIFPTQDYINRIAKYTDRVYATTVMNEINTYTFNTFEFESLNGRMVVSDNGLYVGLYATNNLTKIKDTEWFNEDVYVDSTRNIASGKLGSKLFYKYYSTNYEYDGLIKVKRRTWPSS